MVSIIENKAMEMYREQEKMRDDFNDEFQICNQEIDGIKQKDGARKYELRNTDHAVTKLRRDLNKSDRQIDMANEKTGAAGDMARETQEEATVLKIKEQLRDGERFEFDRS